MAEWKEINKRGNAKKRASVMFTGALQQDMFVKPYRELAGSDTIPPTLVEKSVTIKYIEVIVAVCKDCNRGKGSNM